MASPRQTSFHAGELDPELWGRVDLERYRFSARKSRNAFVGPHGGWKNRPGFQYLGSVFDPTRLTRLVTFSFSGSVSIVLEITGGVGGPSGWIRFWYQGALVAAPSPGTLPAYSAVTSYDRGTWVASGGISYVSLQGANLAHTPVSSPTWWEPATSYRVASPWHEQDLQRLRFAQVGDVITITHWNIPTYELARLSASSWTLTELSFDAPPWPTPGDLALQTPYLDSPVPIPTVPEPARGWFWLVTAVVRSNAGVVYESTPHLVNAKATYAGSPPVATTSALPNEIAVYQDLPVTVRMATTGGLVVDPGYRVLAYRVYRGLGIWDRDQLAGWVGDMGSDGAGGTQLKDTGVTPDYARQPPQGLNPFVVRGYDDSVIRVEVPSTVTFFAQRRVFAGTAQRGDEAWLSKLDDFKNYDRAAEPSADDAIDLVLAAYEREEVRACLPSDGLLIATSAGWWRATPAQGLVIAPGAVEVAAPEGWHFGISYLDALVAGGRVLFAQEKGTVVRMLERDSNGFAAPDVSAYSRHLFRDHDLVDRAWMRDPHHLAAWLRDDGLALVLTWKPEDGIAGWSWWDTDGAIESVASAAEGQEDRLYAVVRRTVNGATVRYVERLASRTVTERRLGVFLDAALTYDGRNATANGMTVISGVIALDEVVGLQTLVNVFAPGDVGKTYVFGGSAGLTRVEVTAYNSPTSVDGLVVSSNGAGAVVGVYRTDWAREESVITGLTHLKFRDVVVLADGGVVRGLEVDVAGSVTLPVAVSVAHVGLEYLPELELLDVGEEKYREKIVKRVFVEVAGTGDFEAGPDLDHLTPWQPQRRPSKLDPWGQPPLVSETAEVTIRGEWAKGGRVSIRQPDPLPLQVVSVTRDVEAGGA